MDDKIASAKAEAVVLGRLLNVLVGATPFKNVEIVGTTIVYQRGGKTFHLVVHDMTGFPKDGAE